jgi:hypothetical protein
MFQVLHHYVTSNTSTSNRILLLYRLSVSRRYFLTATTATAQFIANKTFSSLSSCHFVSSYSLRHYQSQANDCSLYLTKRLNYSTSTMDTLGKYPAKAHALKVASALVAEGVPREDAVIYLEGDRHSCRHDTDVEQHFRQESNFYYISGVELAGYHLVYHMAREQLVLLPTRMPADEIVWHGQPPSTEELATRYDVDEVRYVDELPALFDHWHPKTLYTLPRQKLMALGPNWPQKLTVNKEQLVDALTSARINKDTYELALMRQANQISSDAHIKLMRQARMGGTERELDALFTYEVTRQG